MSVATQADDVSLLLIAAGVAVAGLYLVKALGGLGGLGKLGNLNDSSGQGGAGFLGWLDDATTLRYEPPDIWTPAAEWWSESVSDLWVSQGYEKGYIPSGSEQVIDEWNYLAKETDPGQLIPDIEVPAGWGDGVTDWMLNNRVF